MTRFQSLCIGWLAWVWLVSACAPTAPQDALTQVTQRGTLVVATDSAYPPQSSVVAGAARASDTRCDADQYTANQMQGFDVEVAQAVAKELKVEACFVTPAWDDILAGNWQGQWDVSIGSMAITSDRLQKLSFAQPYYTTPLAVFIHRDSVGQFTRVEQLRTQPIAVCGGCTSETYLRNTLELPDKKQDSVIENPDIRLYYGDAEALTALTAQEVTAALVPLLTGQQAASQGAPVLQLSRPLYYEYNAPAFDRAASLSPRPLAERISAIIKTLHTNGTLKTLSQKFYEADVASPAANFDPPAP